MVNETATDVIVEYQQEQNGSVTKTTHMTTSTVHKFSLQNGTTSNGIVADQILTKVNNINLNGPEPVLTKVEEIISIKSGDSKVESVEPAKTSIPLQTSASSFEFLNGPDQVLPATEVCTSVPNGRVKLGLEESGMAATTPISVPGLLHKIAKEYPDVPALAYKEDGHWKTITYKKYEEQVRTCAKGFIKLGLERYHAVCILGFNSVEWFLSDLGAIFAGGFAAGIYTTNSPEACHYCAKHSRANIIVVEDKKQLDKIIEIKDRLPDLKAIVQYHGKPEVEGIFSWDELMRIGSEEPDTELNNRLKSICINECCTLVYTSGTVGNPKAAMLSHDNFTWDAVSIIDYIEASIGGKEYIVSFLPLSHVAAQIIDIYIGIAVAGTVYFADKDALKGSLVKTLQEVRPTRFLAVPRVWEKIYEKMQQIGSQSGALKRAIASWAKGHAYQHHVDRMNGIQSNTFSYMLARTLIFSKIKQALGLDRCTTVLSGAAPISVDIKKYFMSIDLPVMDAFGMSETTGGHTISHHNEFRLESVGRKRPGVYSKVIDADEDQQGEVCFKGRHIFMGYMNDPEKTHEAFDEEGWLHSGDIGRIDEDGYLYITGRIKELIITAGGENIAPVLIEEEVKSHLPCISNAMLIGDRRKFLSILLTFKTEMNMDTGEPLDELTAASKQWCRELGCQANTVTEVLNGPNEKIMAAIQKGIDEANTKAISNAQRVQKFHILSHDFSIPTGEIGPSMKLKRNVVIQKYADVIERFYQET